MSARESLISATTDLLWERGYVGTSPQAVLDRSGVGKGSLYHFFSGKHDLALIAIERNAESLLAAARAALEGEGTGLERLQGYLEGPREVLRGCRVGGLTQDPEIINDPTLLAPVASAMRTLQDLIAAVIGDCMAAGELRGGVAPADLAATVLATVQGGFVLARAAGTDEPFNQAIRGAIALVDQLKVTS